MPKLIEFDYRFSIMAEVSTGRAEFKARGVCVQRGACVARDVKALHEEINASLRELLRLPGKAQDRHFLHFPVTAEQRRKIVKDPTHQREYTPKMSPKVEAVVRSVLEGKAGAILESVLGRDPQLSELLAIVSHPGWCWRRNGTWWSCRGVHIAMGSVFELCAHFRCTYVAPCVTPLSSLYSPLTPPSTPSLAYTPRGFLAFYSGAKGQTLHSDSQWSATSTKLITVFLALHDIDDEIMGPTRFCPETHEPSCFEDGQ